MFMEMLKATEFLNVNTSCFPLRFFHRDLPKVCSRFLSLPSRQLCVL